MRLLTGMACALGVTVLAASCGLSSDDAVPVRVEVRPSTHNVLTAVVQVDAEYPVLPTVTATSEDGHEVQAPQPVEDARHHAFALVGLRADQTYSIDIAGDPNLARAATDLTFTTGALPEDLPEVVVEATDRATPGYTLFNASASDSSVPHPGNLIAVDETGEVVWYHQSDRSMADVRRLADGTIIYNHDSTGARRIDVLGDLVAEWTTTARVAAGRWSDDDEELYSEDAVVLDTVRLHHEVAFELPSGNFLALGMEVREIDGFPSDLCGDDDPLPAGPRPIRGDIVLEYTPDGEIVTQLPILDAVDPVAVPGVAMCETRRDPFVNDNQPFVDWTHGNSAQVFADRNLVLVSVRHLNQVLALRWEDDEAGPAGELVWALGEGGDFDLTEGEWFVQQHAPEWLDDGSILVYDNGTERPGTVPAGGTEDPFSRAVIYEIEPPTTVDGRGTAHQVWEHRVDGPDGRPEYASFLGDADLIGDDHVLITHGALADDLPDSRARIIEVERSSGDIVLDIELPADGVGWRTYRAEHLDEL